MTPLIVKIPVSTDMNLRNGIAISVHPPMQYAEENRCFTEFSGAASASTSTELNSGTVIDFLQKGHVAV